MRRSRLEVVDGSAAGAWIASELAGDPGTVAGSVPNRYKAYVRIFHPAADGADNPVTWNHIAAALGRRVHPLMQWNAITGSHTSDCLDLGRNWQDPAEGSLASWVLIPLRELLATYTGKTGRCFFGIWTGWSWTTTLFVPKEVYGVDSEDPSPLRSTNDLSFAFSAQELDHPRLELPPLAGRDYTILSGPLSSVTDIAGWISPSTPQLFWPTDRSWFVASEIDFDSTLVGGSEKLIDAILEVSAIEALPVSPSDLLTFDADLINATPETRSDL